MQMTPYLSFNGQCEEAFKFYEQALGGRTGDLYRYGGSPMDVPAGWEDKIMHGTLTIGDQVLMGADAPPGQYEEPRGTSLSLHITKAAEAERVFQNLVEGGKVVMPIQETFWAEWFGMLVDRFGTPWMINCEKAEASQRA